MINWLLFNVQTINLLFSVAGLLMLVATVVLIFDYFFNGQNLYVKWVSPYIWLILITVTAGASATTLLYSEVFGFIPCSLCWLQRIALYPQVLLSATAFKLKDTKNFPLYGVVIATAGLLVAVYHYIYQALPQSLHQSGLLPCLADGSADCSKKVMEVFGFVTYPFLSGVLFLCLIVLYLHLLRANKDKNNIT